MDISITTLKDRDDVFKLAAGSFAEFQRINGSYVRIDWHKVDRKLKVIHHAKTPMAFSSLMDFKYLLLNPFTRDRILLELYERDGELKVDVIDKEREGSVITSIERESSR